MNLNTEIQMIKTMQNVESQLENLKQALYIQSDINQKLHEIETLQKEIDVLELKLFYINWNN